MSEDNGWGVTRDTSQACGQLDPFNYFRSPWTSTAKECYLLVGRHISTLWAAVKHLRWFYFWGEESAQTICKWDNK